MDWLSDARRPVVLPIALAAMGACVAAWLAIGALVPYGYDALMVAPAAHDGEALVLSLFTVEAIDGPQRYRLRKADASIPVEGPTAELRVGEDLSLGTVFRASDHVLVEKWRVLAPGRDGKRALGVLAALVTAGLLPLWYRVERGRIVARA